jgi:hypothetical protein
MREGRVQAEPRRQDADAVGAEHAQQVGPRGIKHSLLLLRVEPGGHDDRRARAELAESVDQRGDGRRRRAQHCQVREISAGRTGVAWQVSPSRVACFGIDGVDRPGELARSDVAPDRRADAAGRIEAPTTAIDRGSSRRSRCRTLIGCRQTWTLSTWTAFDSATKPARTSA